MSIAEALEQTRKLSLDERRQLAEILISEMGPGDELSEETRVELDCRAEAALAHPERCRSWDEIKVSLQDKAARRE